MKKFLLAAIATVALFAANASLCNAEPIYDTSTDVPSPGNRRYSAFVSDYFSQYGRFVGITIGKNNVIANSSPRDSYAYVIEINQLTNENPFRVKSVLIMSETDSVEIPANNPYRTNGLDFVTERILYTDPGKVNRVIKSVWSKMLIRIYTTSGAIYDYYPSRLYITYAKKVADWASR